MDKINAQMYKEDEYRAQIADINDKRDKIMLDLVRQKDIIKTKDAMVREYNQKLTQVQAENEKHLEELELAK